MYMILPVKRYTRLPETSNSFVPTKTGKGSGSKPRTDDQLLAARGVFIKPFAALDAKVTGRDHIGQQGTGRIFRLAKPIVLHAEDREAHIQPDKIRQLQRPHR